MSPERGSAKRRAREKEHKDNERRVLELLESLRNGTLPPDSPADLS
jgi:hypothetical protein